MFIFPRSIAAPLAALTVLAIFILYDVLFTSASHDSTAQLDTLVTAIGP